MKNVFIGCSSYDSIDEKYKSEATLVAKICAKKGYNLFFGATRTGSMGKIYDVYKEYPNRKINAICMKEFINDSKCLDENVNLIITNTTIEQMGIFMNCDKIVYLPGGYGTITELTYLINAKVNGIHNKDILIVNTTHYYDKILEQFDIALNEKFIKTKDIYKVVENINDLEKLL